MHTVQKYCSISRNQSTRQWTTVNFTAWQLYLRKITAVSTEQEVGWAPQPFWTAIYKRKISYTCRDSNPGRSSP
jgi:hypothetical protein